MHYLVARRARATDKDVVGGHLFLAYSAQHRGCYASRVHKDHLLAFLSSIADLGYGDRLVPYTIQELVAFLRHYLDYHFFLGLLAKVVLLLYFTNEQLELRLARQV